RALNKEYVSVQYLGVHVRKWDAIKAEKDKSFNDLLNLFSADATWYEIMKFDRNLTNFAEHIIRSGIEQMFFRSFDVNFQQRDPINVVGFDKTFECNAGTRYASPQTVFGGDRTLNAIGFSVFRNE